MGLSNIIKNTAGRFTGRANPTGTTGRRSGTGRLNTPGRGGVGKPGPGGIGGMIRSILNRR
ncbi:hypothetical protein [Arthrobacter sp. Br18]|uniref:hypothetical protein n=1 Tax=Arthrobacter sp. Br18 TaxID=1312954 RepID=UPI00047BAC6D|nr:hypothetical protein [Arthrobacter sp. Br18]